MGVNARRTFIIEPVAGEDGVPGVDEESLWKLLQQLVPTLIAIGGKVTIVADRVKLGDLPEEGGQREPIAETVGFLTRWEAVPKLREQPLTSTLMDVVLSGDEVGGDPEPVGAPQGGVGQEQEPEGEGGDLAPDSVEAEFEEPEPELDEEEELEVECNCDGGIHEPPCPYATAIAQPEEVV